MEKNARDEFFFVEFAFRSCLDKRGDQVIARFAAAPFDQFLNLPREQSLVGKGKQNLRNR